MTEGNTLSFHDPVYVPESVADRFPACRVRPGDLVFPHRGAIGRVGLVRQEDALLSSSMMKLTSNCEVADPEFLFYYFRGPGQRELLMRASTVGTPGIAQPLASLRSIPIALPELKEQRAIAEVLGALDNKIAANLQVSSRAHELAEVVYRARTVGWARRPMIEVLDPISGGTPSRTVAAYWNGAVPWVSAKDIATAAHGVVVRTEEQITDQATAETRVKPVPPGSVILTARGTVGRVARLGVAAAFNQSCYGFSPGVLPAGLLYFAIREAAEQTAALAHGSVFDTITLNTFRHIQIPVTVEDESLEAQLSALLESIRGVTVESQALGRTRDQLLPLLMSGKVRVRDAEKVVEGVV